LGIFIGRRGQTIDAVEYLASIAVFPGPHARKRVELDAEGYKERRQRQIERMATKKAQEAVKRGRPVQLNPMTPAERKIVHITLKDRDDVTTASQGREPHRSVVISPVR
jgi:spoIIIJ-associated protein